MLWGADSEKVDTKRSPLFQDTRDRGRRFNMANQLGKRYQCQTCGTVTLCTKAGDGPVMCCLAEMDLQDPRKLPSSD